MNLKDKKLILIHQLEQESRPITLKDLLEKLADNYPERSVRRWLNELVSDGLVNKIGSKRGTAYTAAKRKIENAAAIISHFSAPSTKVIERIRRPIYERVPVIYNEGWFNSYEPNTTHYIPENIIPKLHSAGLRSREEDPAGTYAHQIFNRLLIDLSYNSSRLEGNTYSLLDTQKLLFEGASAEGKLDEEKIMILNHKEAIRYLVDAAPRLKVEAQTVYTLHYLLSEGLVESKYAGKVRDHGVRIGGSAYIPFEDPKRLQLQLEKILQKASLIQDPFEQSIFLLIHVSYLQAFADVNKRTARLCANIPLVTRNLVPQSFNDVEREDYTYAMLAVYELQEVNPIVDLFIFSYLRTCVMYDSTVKAMGFDEVRVRYRQERRALLRTIITEGLAGSELKEFATSQISKIVNLTDQQAVLEDLYEDLEQMDVNRIVGLGVTVNELENWFAKYRIGN